MRSRSKPPLVPSASIGLSEDLPRTKLGHPRPADRFQPSGFAPAVVVTVSNPQAGLRRTSSDDTSACENRGALRNFHDEFRPFDGRRVHAYLVGPGTARKCPHRTLAQPPTANGRQNEDGLRSFSAPPGAVRPAPLHRSRDIEERNLVSTQAAS